jgi:hypothetical protein
LHAEKRISIRRRKAIKRQNNLRKIKKEKHMFLLEKNIYRKKSVKIPYV